LRRLQDYFPDGLIVIGIHSAKFPTEKSSSCVRQAVLRLGIEHPVVIDPLLEMWERYRVHTWPTQVLIDPQGRITRVTSGEFLADRKSVV
jgi:hypothetical protein